MKKRIGTRCMAEATRKRLTNHTPRLLCLVLCALLIFNLPMSAQKRKTTTRKKAQTTQVTRKKATKTARKRNAKNSSTANTNTAIKGLKNQSAQIKRNIKEQERKLRSNERDVKQRLQNLMVINSEIADKRKTIDTIRHDINRLDGNIGQLNTQMKNLQAELEDRKQKYVKSMRYMHRNSSIQSQLMFIFSAKSFTQMYRRLRFMREYANYQRAQGEMVKVKQAEITNKHTQLTSAKKQKSGLLRKGEQEQKHLEGKQVEQQNVVSSLQKQQKTIQGIIAEQRKKDEAINAQIDRLVAIEVEKARQRAIAEAKRKAEAEAAKKRAEEIARKKAAAEAAARENARRIAEAKAREERLKAEARAAAKAKDAEERRAAEQAAREAEKARREVERKAETDAREHEREVAEAKKQQTATFTMDSNDRRISGNFESNRGRLPMPITGGYRIVSHFGQYNVEGLSNVRLDNKGINILGQSGACARSIYDGEVSAVFNLGGTNGVIVRHGSYISVYCNLASVSVHKGQHVSTRQVLGTVGQDNILQFQLRKEKAKLNPEAWLGR